MATAAPKRMGRPSVLTQVVRYREQNGAQVPVTAGEQVIERRGLGLDDQAAADSAGISRQTLHNWRLGGARARAIEARGIRELTLEEVELANFLDSLESAEAEWEASRLAIIQRGAQGGFTTTKTVEKYTPGPNNTQMLVERIVTTETANPQWQAAAWQLERMKREKYARRWEVAGAEGAPLLPEQDQAKALADSAREYLRGVADAQAAKPARKGRNKEAT